MKSHAIIPIFIPHKGCPNDCVFCNQRKITAKIEVLKPWQVRETIDTWLTTLKKVPHVEVAFYGGSFTGLPIEEQNIYLDIAKEYKEKGLIDGIHLSTRPDYINQEILLNLKSHLVDTIELGVQSFDKEVLSASKRGHTEEQVYRACSLIKKMGFTLGIQLMIGLPKDTLEKDIESAQKAASLKPEIGRLYPTVVIEDTELYNMAINKAYIPLKEKEAVERTKAMYEILQKAGVNIIRVGLKSSDLIKQGDTLTGSTFHPAFRQLVEGAIARESMEKAIEEAIKEKTLENKNVSFYDFIEQNLSIVCYSSPSDISNMVGNKGINREFFKDKYPNFTFSFKGDPSLSRNLYRVEIE